MNPSRLRAASTALALAALTLVACDLSPEVGPPLVDRCANADTDPSAAVSFSRDIQPLILRPSGGCVPCHDPSRENNIGVTVGGLALSDYDLLRAGGVRSGAGIVTPGRPCDSVLYQKVSAGPPFGSRMPLNGPPFLPANELALIHDWIAEGAEDN